MTKTSITFFRRALFAATFALVPCVSTAIAQTTKRPPLDLEDVVALLGVEETTDAVRISVIKKRCVSFRLTDPAELKLRRAGAENPMLAAIKGACYVRGAANVEVAQQAQFADEGDAPVATSTTTGKPKSNLEKKLEARIEKETNKLNQPRKPTQSEIDEAKLKAESEKVMADAEFVATALDGLLANRAKSNEKKAALVVASDSVQGRFWAGKYRVKPVLIDSTEVVLPEVQGRLVSAGFVGAWGGPDKFAGYDGPGRPRKDVQYWFQKIALDLKGDTTSGFKAGAMRKQNAGKGVSFQLVFAVPNPDQTTEISISCNHYDEEGQVMREASNTTVVGKRGQRFHWVSTNEPDRVWMPGVYFVKCATGGRVIASGAYLVI